MKYSVKSRFVAAKPRKNRGNTASSGSSDYSGGSGNVVLTGSVESDGHTHANLASLNQIETNPSSPDGYIYLSSTNKDNGDVVKTKAKSGFSDESAHAITSDEATHADVADIAHNLDDWSVADNRYLSRVNDDTAQGILSFAKSIQSTAFKAASESFDGAGWAIVRDTDGLSTLVADNLRLRGTLTAHELVVRQVRAICGALGISQACGKVREVDYDAESSSYHLVMEGDATHGYGGFQSGDFIRCQRFTQNGINGYWVQISDVVDGGRILTVQRTEFAWIHQGSGQNDYDCCDYGSLIVNDDNAIITTDDGLYALAYGYSKNGDASYNEACLPMSGDEIVQYGSSINKERQSAIYIHTDANGTPAIDLLEGIKTKSFDGCLRCRLGGVLPDGGFGLYVNNGTILSTGSNKEHYALRPDGSFNLGQGAIKYDPTNGIVTIADNVSINWGASSQEGVEYALSTDGVTPPTSGWTTLSKISSDKGGKYLWTRTRYPNGTYAYSVSYQAVDGVKGDKGDKGEQGIQGEKGEKGDKGDQGIQGLQGLQGERGLQGIQGKDGVNGKDGKTTYFHIKYSSVKNPTSSQMSETPNKYIGTYVDFQPTDSNDPKAYTWYQFQGMQGEQGVPGIGVDGKTSYLHIKYSNDGGKTFTSNNGESVGYWIGVCTDFNVNDPTSVSAYQWSKTKGEKGDKGDKGDQGIQGLQGLQGIPGKNGTNGNTTYFHIRYSSLPNPTYEGQMSTSPKEYIGTYVDFTKEDSTNPKMYQWYRFQGLQGPQGEQGVPGVGKDGKTSYLHIKYSNDGGKTFTSNNGETIGTWIGVCTDFNLNDPSNVSAYQWSKTKGEQGAKGDKGPQGPQGPQGDRGNDGADGQNMRQNLADYTEFLPEIFEKKPDGITLNGTRKVGLDGCGALYAKCATTKDDVWMFQQNVISRLVSNEWYTISFYAKADIASSSIAVYMRSGSTDSVVKLNEVGKLDGKDYTIKSEAVTFALSNVFVRHTFTFKTASTLPDKAYLLFRLFGAIKDAYITQVKLERSSVASDWCRSETDKVAAVNLPEWLDTWNGQTTSANAQYVAARNAFFGVRDTNDKYTGIMMSSEGLKINGESQAIGGLYALSNNEVKIAIDPTKSIYRFQGKVLCDGGQMEGLHVGASLNGITSIDSSNFDTYFLSELRKGYAVPNFYAINPVVIMNYLKSSDAKGNAIHGIILPPYTNPTAEDYNLSLGLLGKTIFIINKTGSSLKVQCSYMTAADYALKLSGKGGSTSSPLYISNGFSASLTAHLSDDSSVFWVVEKPNTQYGGTLDGNVPILPPSGNDYWLKDFTEL